MSVKINKVPHIARTMDGFRMLGACRRKHLPSAKIAISGTIKNNWMEAVMSWREFVTHWNSIGKVFRDELLNAISTPETASEWWLWYEAWEHTLTPAEIKEIVNEV